MLAGCGRKAAAPPAAPQALPVKVMSVANSPVPVSDTYVATIKSRRSATLQSQVDGNLTRIYVHAGQAVRSGQLLMQINPLKQVATVQQQQGLQAQQKALYEFNKSDVERQQKLFKAGIISKQAFDQAEQQYQNSKGAYEASAAQTGTQRAELAYYEIRAPFAGVVGDIPVHLGDYISPQTLLTTVDENKDLQAYIYVPTERAADLRTGLPVAILDTSGEVQAQSTISFISPQVENGLQSVLALADIPHSAQRLRNSQLVRARITWSTAPAPVIPVLAVTRIGGQDFAYVAKAAGNGYVAHQVAVTLGPTLGNTYPVRSGLHPGERVIVSGLQFLQEGAPVHPLG